MKIHQIITPYTQVVNNNPDIIVSNYILPILNETFDNAFELITDRTIKMKSRPQVAGIAAPSYATKGLFFLRKYKAGSYMNDDNTFVYDMYLNSITNRGNLTIYYTKIKGGVLFAICGNGSDYGDYKQYFACAFYKKGDRILMMVTRPATPAEDSSKNALCIYDFYDDTFTDIAAQSPNLPSAAPVISTQNANLAKLYIPKYGFFDNVYIPTVFPDTMTASRIFTLNGKEYMSMASLSGKMLPVFECEED